MCSTGELTSPMGTTRIFLFPSSFQNPTMCTNRLAWPFCGDLDNPFLFTDPQAVCIRCDD